MGTIKFSKFWNSAFKKLRTFKNNLLRKSLKKQMIRKNNDISLALKNAIYWYYTPIYQ